jgi:hypothetical protein
MQYGGQRELRTLREGEAANPADWPRDGDGEPARSQGGPHAHRAGLRRCSMASWTATSRPSVCC